MRKFLACYPQPAFPSVSLTGTKCDLSCKHCMGKYLRFMIPCEKPEELLRVGFELAAQGAKGLLISGGYNSAGYVPLEPFLGALRLLKKETGLFLNLHTGLVPKGLVQELAEIEVDMVSFDLVGDGETVEMVSGIRRGPEEYGAVLAELLSSIPHVVPHLCLGLHAGRMVGESRAIRMLMELEVRSVVFLVLIPTRGTPFERVPPPQLVEVERIFTEARERLPRAELILGCMRPGGRYREKLDELALRKGFSRIALPSPRTVGLAKEMGLEVERLEGCCAIPV